MISLAEAQQVVLQHAHLQPDVSTAIEKSQGHVLATDVYSPLHVPPFNNSAMDGYAIHASPQTTYPCLLPIIGAATAGHVFADSLPVNTAIKIMTGAQVPPETTAVVPWEDTQSHVTSNQVEVLSLPRLGQHIRLAGEDFQAGTQVMARGQVLTPAAIGLLASLGLPEIPVYMPVRVAVLATGSELAPVTLQHLEPGQIRDSNSYTLAALIQQAGGVAKRYGIIADEPENMRQMLTLALTEADVLVTSGGVSVGEHDYVQEVLTQMGFQPVFWKVAIKPGKPILFGTLSGKLVFGLPGNPAAAVTGFEQLVRPAMRQMMGHRCLFKPSIQATLTQNIHHPGSGRMHLVRSDLQQVDGGWQVTPLPHQSSGNLLTVLRANAVVHVSHGLYTGQVVAVQALDWPETQTVKKS